MSAWLHQYIMDYGLTYMSIESSDFQKHFVRFFCETAGMPGTGSAIGYDTVDPSV